MKILGIDIGGTHMTCAEVTIASDTCEVGTPSRTVVNSGGTRDEILRQWCDAIYGAGSVDELSAIGIAMPGPCDYGEGICLIRGLDKYESLYGTNLRREIRQRLSLDCDFRIVFKNDCNAFALGEWKQGAGQDGDRIIGITLGTGFGSGFVADGSIVHDGPGVPPEATLGFVPFRDGIAEDYVSRRGLRRLYADDGGNVALDVADIADAARGGELRALRLFARLGDMLSEIAAPWIRMFEADTFIIGGAISGAYDLFAETLSSCLPETVRLTRAALPDTAGLLGAAILASRDLAE